MELAVNNIMFVCTGNICRSALAEYLFNHDERFLSLGMKANSAGVGALVGHSIDPSITKLLAADHIDSRAHIAQQVSQELLSNADIVLVMEQHHRQALLTRFPRFRSKMFLLRHKEQLGVIDPYKKDFSVFEQIHGDIKKGLDEWSLTLNAL